MASLGFTDGSFTLGTQGIVRRITTLFAALKFFVLLNPWDPTQTGLNNQTSLAYPKESMRLVSLSLIFSVFRASPLLLVRLFLLLLLFGYRCSLPRRPSLLAQ